MAHSKPSKAPRLRNALGLAIRKTREEKGWSQADLARQLQILGWDVERTVVTKIELRKRCITDYELLLILAVLGTSLDLVTPPQVKELVPLTRHIS